MSRCFSLAVELVCGSSVTESVLAAGKLAQALPGVSYVEYKFNDSEMTVYHDGFAMEVRDGRLVANWTLTDGVLTRREIKR